MPDECSGKGCPMWQQNGPSPNGALGAGGLILRHPQHSRMPDLCTGMTLFMCAVRPPTCSGRMRQAGTAMHRPHTLCQPPSSTPRSFTTLNSRNNGSVARSSPSREPSQMPKGLRLDGHEQSVLHPLILSNAGPGLPF